MKILLIFSLFLLPFQLFAIDKVGYKFSLGTISPTSIASEIELEKDNTNSDLSEYKGKDGGTEMSLAVLLDNLELSYIVQNYTAEKNSADETGEITFKVETLEAMLYTSDLMQDSGFNFGIGAGKGVARISVDKEVSGSKVIDNGVILAKEYHFVLGLLYNFNQNNVVSLKYYSQTMNTATGTPFTNMMAVLLYSYQF